MTERPFEGTGETDEEVSVAEAADTSDAAVVESVAADMAGIQSHLADDVALADDVIARVEALERDLVERTSDVQRVQAEYANYRKRVDRDRELVRDQAVAATLGELLTVLDDIDRAAEHGELVGGFRSVADGLQAAAAKLGLQRFGEPGDVFDPAIHEAMTHTFSEAVESATCVQVFQPGYRHADRVIRPARVAVAEPGQPD